MTDVVVARPDVDPGGWARLVPGISCGIREASRLFFGQRSPAPGLPRAMRLRRIARFLPCPATSRTRIPGTLIKRGAKRLATWEDVWEELPENVRLALAPARTDESPAEETASLFPSGDNPLSPHERKIYALLKADEATHIDAIVECLEQDMSSSEIFAPLLELELAGKVRQLPGKNFVRCF